MYTNYVTVHCRVIPLLFAFPFLHSLLLSICLPLLTWNPPCCDRIRPPRSQVARKLIFRFPSPLLIYPSFQNPDPLEIPRSKYTFIRTTSRIWLTRSSTLTLTSNSRQKSHVSDIKKYLFLQNCPQIFLSFTQNSEEVCCYLLVIS
jgi:hypothetical protein